MNAYAVTLSKYVNTGILALFTLLSYVGLPMRPGRLRRAIEIVQRLLLVGFLVNANMTIAWLTGGAAGRTLLLLCAMEILFMLSFMVLYRIVHEMANMMLFNNICMLLSVGYVIIARIALYGNSEDTAYRAGEPIKQFVIASAGMMIMLLIPFFRRFFDSMRHLGFVFGILGIVLLACVLFLSPLVYGANITFTIAGFTFQPSELVKILYIMMLAGMLSGEVSVPKAVFVSILAVTHVGILALSTDLGSALIFFIVYLMMMFMATGKWRVLFLGGALGSLGAVAGYFLFSHVQERVAIWKDPFPLIDDQGFQIAHSLFAISFGGLWGAGLTQGAPSMIPKVESDFIFSAIAEEMGLIFSVCLLFLCINCFLRILILSASYSNRFFQLFTYGAAVCYIFQTFLTVGGETKFIPMTGVTLPLVSYGGSSVLSTLIMFGMIEMIFILHDERTARFMERYKQEHNMVDNGSGAYGAYGTPAGYGVPSGGYEGYGTPAGGIPAGGYYNYGDPAGGVPAGGYEGYGASGRVPGLYESNLDGSPVLDAEIADACVDTSDMYENITDNFPVNGISEEGIFESDGNAGSRTNAGRSAFYQGADLDGRR